jgi:hypothetical protein
MIFLPLMLLILCVLSTPELLAGFSLACSLLCMIPAQPLLVVLLYCAPVSTTCLKPKKLGLNPSRCSKRRRQTISSGNFSDENEILNHFSRGKLHHNAPFMGILMPITAGRGFADRASHRHCCKVRLGYIFVRHCHFLVDWRQGFVLKNGEMLPKFAGIDIFKIFICFVCFCLLPYVPVLVCRPFASR